MLIQFFNVFDPIKGKIPPKAPKEFIDIVERARLLIKNRSRKEILYAANTISLILEDGAQLHIEQSVKDEETKFFISPARSLRATIQLYDISNQEDFPNATWAEYFAVLALWLVSNALFLNSRYFEFLGVPKDKIGRSLSTAQYQLAYDALEAVCYGELLNDVDIKIEIRIKDQNQLRAKKGGIKIHEKRNEIKSRFIQYYFDNKFINMTAAARQFHETLSEAEMISLGVYAKPDIERNIRTLLGALREYKKSALGYPEEPSL